MPTIKDFPQKVFLHILDRLKSVIPVIIVEDTQFSRKGNNMMYGIFLDEDKLEWDFRIVMTRRAHIEKDTTRSDEQE